MRAFWSFIDTWELIPISHELFEASSSFYVCVLVCVYIYTKLKLNFCCVQKLIILCIIRIKFYITLALVQNRNLCFVL